MTKEKIGYLYRFPCEGGKYYVGITEGPVEERLKKHANGKSKAQFVDRYPMIKSVKDAIKIHNDFSGVYVKEISLSEDNILPKFENQYELLLMAFFGPQSMGGGFNRLNKGEKAGQGNTKQRNEEFLKFLTNNLNFHKKKYNVPNVFMSSESERPLPTSEPYQFKGIVESLPEASWTFGPQDCFPKDTNGKSIEIQMNHELNNKITNATNPDSLTKYTEELLKEYY